MDKKTKAFEKYFKKWFDANWRDWQTEEYQRKEETFDELEEQGFPYELEQAFKAGWDAKGN